VTHRLTKDQARRLIVRAQLLDAERAGDVVEVAEQLGAIKIDPTATIAPAEHSILWSRLGWAYEPVQLSKAVERDRLLFEFEGAFRPVSLLPLMLPAMRRWMPRRPSSLEWFTANEGFATEIVARLRGEGALLAGGIPDTAVVARPPDGWSGSNQVPIMLEFLQQQGLVAVAGREGRQRRWDLAERVYPQDLPEYPDDEAARLLDARRLRAAGLAKQRSPWTPVGEAGEPAVIEGLKQKWRVDPEVLASLDDDDDPGGRVALLNPYDGLLFDRPRLRDVFEFEYVLEQFKPKPQRRYGYFAYPILAGDRFVGMLDAEVDRERGALAIAAVHEFLPFEPEETRWCAPRSPSSRSGSGSASWARPTSGEQLRDISRKYDEDGCMTSTIEELMHANLHEVFAERDAEKRAAAIARIYRDDVVFSDPDELVVGRAALAAKAQKLLDDAPGFAFVADGPIRVNHDMGHLAWAFGPAGQEPIVRGFDIAFVENGLIAKVYTLLTQTPS
jgi:uncharacterized protein YcaQ